MFSRPVGPLNVPVRPGVPLRYGHRGVLRLEVENTERALRTAFARGADGVEVDVQQTRDGHLVLFHDERTGRLAPGSKDAVASELTLAELRALDLGDGQRVLTLDEALDLVAEYPGKRLNIELKSKNQCARDHDRPADLTDRSAFLLGRKVAAALARRPELWKTVSLSAYEPLAISGFRSRPLPVPAALLFEACAEAYYPQDAFESGSLQVLGQTAQRIGAQGVNLHHPYATAAAVEALEPYGIGAREISVYTWGDEELTPKQERELTELGIGALILNDPVPIF